MSEGVHACFVGHGGLWPSFVSVTLQSVVMGQAVGGWMSWMDGLWAGCCLLCVGCCASRVLVVVEARGEETRRDEMGRKWRGKGKGKGKGKGREEMRGWCRRDGPVRVW